MASQETITIIQRIALAVVGGYGFSNALATFGAAGLSTLLPRSEAVVLMAMLAFVVYLILLLWAFAEPRLLRLWLVLAAVPVAAHMLAVGLRATSGGA